MPLIIILLIFSFFATAQEISRVEFSHRGLEYNIFFSSRVCIVKVRPMKITDTVFLSTKHIKKITKLLNPKNLSSINKIEDSTNHDTPYLLDIFYDDEKIIKIRVSSLRVKRKFHLIQKFFRKIYYIPKDTDFL